MIVVTHYQRLLNYIVPDFVHVLAEGRIVKSGGKELALELEESGYAGLGIEDEEEAVGSMTRSGTDRRGWRTFATAAAADGAWLRASRSWAFRPRTTRSGASPTWRRFARTRFRQRRPDTRCGSSLRAMRCEEATARLIADATSASYAELSRAMRSSR